MFLSDVSIKRPVFTTMMSLCLLVLGYMGLTRLGTDLYPDVSFPVVIVNTVYKGAGPGEVETQWVRGDGSRIGDRGEGRSQSAPTWVRSSKTQNPPVSLFRRRWSGQR